MHSHHDGFGRRARHHGSADEHPHPGHDGHRGRGGRDGRLRRGDLRPLLLAALLDGPTHGYELMGRLEARAGGAWRPSPGSVYPLLQQLEDEQLVRCQDAEGRKVYQLTDAGRAQADPAAFDDLARARDGAEGPPGLRAEIKNLHLAARQVGLAGTDAQVQQAVEIVRAARQSLYRLLADQ